MKKTFGFLSVLVVGLAATGAGAQIIYPNPINHVIVLDQENRTPDNLFGSNSPSNSYYLPTLDVSTTGLAYTITNGKKTVFNVQAVSSPLSSVVGSGGSQPGFGSLDAYGAPVGGTQSFTIRAVDQAGNVSAPSNAITRKVGACS